MRAIRLRALPALLGALLLLGCPTVREPVLVSPTLPPAHGTGAEPLKGHLRSGQLLILTEWRDLLGDSALAGTGMRYDVRRRPVGPFTGAIRVDSIALLETTHTHTAQPVGSAILGTYTILATIVTVACIADPKSCFGSCPTFYVDGDTARPVAEGFSASVARVLEATDVDRLPPWPVTGRRAWLTMRNEALETHVVRWVRLLAVPRPDTGVVVRTTGGAYHAARVEPGAVMCRGRTGDCRTATAAADGEEWTTGADPDDLGAPDSLDLWFEADSGALALLVTARQAFASTYVFYQTLAYAGSHAGDLLASVEREGTMGFPGPWRMMDRLTRVEVLAGPGAGPLVHAGTVGEPGPIAADEQAVPLGTATVRGPWRVRLRFAQGAWRFDRLALVTLGPQLPATVLALAAVERHGRPDTTALARLLDSSRALVTGPGEDYRLGFDLPDDGDARALFLESRGYYYEWMRPEWVREENPAMLAAILGDPDRALRLMAPGYARLEPRLEELFWSSRYRRER